MNVIHVIEPFASGVTTAIINITRELDDVQHLVIHGSRMWVDTIGNVQRKFPENVKFAEWNHAGREISPVKDLLALFALIKLLKSHKNDIIHLHSSKAGFLGRIACRILGIKKVIYTPHCPAFIRTDVSEKKRNFFRNLEKLGCSFGGKVVGCGESEAMLYRNMGIDAEWVANGVKPEKPVKDPVPDTVTFVGIANYQKNPELFNKIAESFREQDVKFLWVGDGELKDKLVSGNITVTGWMEKEDIQKYLSKTLVYLSTSGWEGLPYGGLEAMNASCALLLKDVPGNRDLVESGINGYLFENHEEAVEKLKLMLSDKTATMKMGEKGNDLIEKKFSLKNMGEGYRKIYNTFAS